MAQDWKAFGLREFPPLSARTRPASLPPLLARLVEDARLELARPLEGISTDGTVHPGLYRLGAHGAHTAPVLHAAVAFLDRLDAEQRMQVTFPLDAEERRMWSNIHPNLFRHGLLLEDLDHDQRTAALDLVAATLSSRGLRQARDIMAINGLLAELTGSTEEFGEWAYFLSVFGEPAAGGPWGWQLDGHHLNLNCLVIGDQLVLAPAFMGSEPCRVDYGPLAGTEVFTAESETALELMASLDTGQRAAAVLRPSILRDDLPAELQHPIDGRMVAGAFADNAVVPFEGLCADRLDDHQRGLLNRLMAVYVGWGRDPHAEVTLAEVDAHLDETHLAWMGPADGAGPFYYRVHSPVVLIEFDHHPGVVFANHEPTEHHIHTVVRAPNGGDYGADLLRQHHEQFDHGDGRHVPRA